MVRSLRTTQFLAHPYYASLLLAFDVNSYIAAGRLQFCGRWRLEERKLTHFPFLFLRSVKIC